jgi:hypothetical protein
VFYVHDKTGSVHQVCDVKSDEYGNVEFLVFNPISGKWEYINANEFAPIVLQEVPMAVFHAKDYE